MLTYEHTLVKKRLDMGEGVGVTRFSGFFGEEKENLSLQEATFCGFAAE
jgi:hypothetical protein